MKKHLVVLTGAGISAESGLKTFRDTDGLWNGYNIEDVATPRAFMRNPKLVLDFYNMRRAEVAKALPNKAHEGLVDLEKHYTVTIVTQNIDDLHERAGSTNVLHLHGEIFKMHSIGSPDKVVDIRGDIQLGDRGPDDTQYRPHIVWFEEPVPLIETAADIMSTADIFVLVGTSLQVYPAAGLIHYTPVHIPKFIIDRKIPVMDQLPNMQFIEQTATEGIQTLLKKLAT
jgi:NAD-dependent deacetylase